VLLDAQDHLAIEQLKSKLTAAIGASDVPAIGGLYTDDAILLAPRRGAVKGLNVRRFWRNMSKRMKNVKFVPDDLESLGAEVVRESGSMSFEVVDQNSEPVAANYLVFWHKRGGEWKISAMTWSRAPNREAPAAS
jgi:ketosteroid isomerase-like protein